ncbi:MAG: tRNA pseudouridine(55) synthase TruB [Lacipirellulaceae bacterium]
MFGILNINKPAGCTSRDVVNRVQRIVKPVKAGHAGTLDPLATGVLVVCLGGATRLIQYVQQMPKTYRGIFLLGQSSPSDDVETEITNYADVPIPTIEQIEAVLPTFIGTIQQRPPAYSAIKQQGQRAYKLAREGKQVELAARPVEIYEITVDGFEYPELQLTIHCGSGTYVRSIGRDLAEALGTKAVMSGLERTAIGSFRVEESLATDAIEPSTLETHLLPAIRAVEAIPRLTLGEKEWQEISHGREIKSDVSLGEIDEVAAVNSQGELVALLKTLGNGRYRATRNFLKPS